MTNSRPPLEPLVSESKTLPQPLPSTTHNILSSLLMGGALTSFTAPAINVFNGVSVVSSRYNLDIKASCKKIYSGELSKENKPGYQNFFAGLKPHLVKELTRLSFKAPGLGVYMPWLQEQYSPNQATQIYAVTMSFAEMVINPIDTWRVVRQSGDPLVNSLSRLYQGAILNGIRQYGIWATVGYNNMLFDPIMKKYGIDPYGAEGILMKAYPQATINIVAVYWLERIKNQLQFGVLPEKSTPLDAARDIYNKQGWAGFYRGFLAKTPGGAIQHLAALTLLAWGKQRMEEQNKTQPTMKKG